MAFTTPYLKLDARVGLVQPTAVLPLSPANHRTNITRFYTPQSKESDYSHLKVKGVCVCVWVGWGGVGGARLPRCWLPWISLKRFWHNAHPTSDVSAKRGDGGEGKSQGERRGGKGGELEAQRRKRRRRRRGSLLLLIIKWAPLSLTGRVHEQESRSGVWLSLSSSSRFFSHFVFLFFLFRKLHSCSHGDSHHGE